MTIGLILAAILLPPLAVYLTEGIGRDFWIAVGLTCLGFVPGAVFSLFVVARNRSVPPASIQQ